MTEALDSALITAAVDPALRGALRAVTVLPQVDSTNSAVFRLPPDEQRGAAILADCQTGGRGRRQRSWHSPPGGNIYLSLGWHFENEELALSNLPLLAAICVAEALERTGLREHGIKWPNDVLVNGRKLAGILVELQSPGNGPASAVIGMGINVRMPRSAEQDPERIIDRPWTDLETHLPPAHRPCDRNRLAATLLDCLLGALTRFERAGFEPFRSAWNRRDLLQGRWIRLDADGVEVAGTACGIDNDGGLLLEEAGGCIHVFHSGEVSVFHDRH